MKFSRAISGSSGCTVKKNDVSKTISVLVLGVQGSDISQRSRYALCFIWSRSLADISTLHPEDEERIFETFIFFIVQPLDPADSPKELHHAK
jgi:hypothetical protein